MKKTLLLIVVLSTGFLSSIPVKSNIKINNVLLLKDTLPITDTVGQSNWQHTLKDTAGENKIDSSFILQRRNDSLHKVPPQ